MTIFLVLTTWSKLAIIFDPGSFTVQFGDHLWCRDHLQTRTIAHFRVALSLFVKATEALCTTTYMKVSSVCMRMKSHFHMKDGQKDSL